MEAASRAEFEPLTPDPVEPGAPPDSPGIHRAPACETPGDLWDTEPASVSPIPRAAPTAPSTAANAAAIVGAAAAQPRGTSALAAQASSAPSAPPVPPVMDRDFIARNQIVERYLSGKLPIKGATEFERFCNAHPEMLDEIGLPERINSGLRLLEAGGKPEPWEQEPKRFWENPYLALGLGVAVLVLLVATVSFARANSHKAQQIAALTLQVAAQPLDPATTTRTIRLLPSRERASSTPAVVIGGGGQTQLADLMIDLSHSPYRQFRVTIDRIDQGRVAIIDNLTKDSNGHLRLALNTSALGPGNYQFTIEGLTWRGEPEPDSWVTIGIRH